MSQQLQELLRQEYDIIVISTGHKEYRNNPELISLLMDRAPAFIYDTIGVLSNEEINRLSGKHRVRVIGRGDL